MKNILALDYGEARIGVAVSRGSLAEPLLILANSPETIDQIFELIKSENIGTILVGLSENKMAERTKEFVANLQNFLTTQLDDEIPVVFFDETLSSQEVAQMLAKSGKKKSDRRQPQDHYVAAYLLDQYLESI